MSSKTPRIDPTRKYTIRELQNLKAAHAVCSKKITDKLISELLEVRETEVERDERDEAMKEMQKKNLLICKTDNSIWKCPWFGFTPEIDIKKICLDPKELDYTVQSQERIVKYSFEPIQQMVFFDKRKDIARSLDIAHYLDSDGYFKWSRQDDPEERPVIRYDLKNGKISFGSYRDNIKLVGENIVINGFWYKVGEKEYRITFGIPFEEQEDLKGIIYELEKQGIDRKQFVDMIWIASLLQVFGVKCDWKKREVIRTNVKTRAHFYVTAALFNGGCEVSLITENQYDFTKEKEQFLKDHAEEIEKCKGEIEKEKEQKEENKQ